MSRDELIAKIAPDNAAPVHAEGDAGLVGLSSSVAATTGVA
jgi:hypothetical protein